MRSSTSGLEVSFGLLFCQETATNRALANSPLASSSSISSSVSFADIDIYSADIEYLLLCRADRVPSYEDMVFWRDMGWNDEDEAVEALDGVCSMTDMLVIARQIVPPLGFVTSCGLFYTRFLVSKLKDIFATLRGS